MEKYIRNEYFCVECGERCNEPTADWNFCSYDCKYDDMEGHRPPGTTKHKQYIITKELSFEEII